MLEYIIKRLFLIIPTFVGICLITFFIMKLAPGDPIMTKLMFSGNISAEALAAQLKNSKPAIELPQGYVALAKKTAYLIHGHKLPDITQSNTFKAFKWTGENTIFFAKWFGNVVRLDFGRSFKDKRPVLLKICEALPVTLLINLATIFIIYIVSIPLGILSAIKAGSAFDKIVMIKLFILYSLPSFWVAIMLLTFFAGGEYFDLFPLTGIVSDNHTQMGTFSRIGDIVWHLTLPVTAETIGSFAFLTRFSRSNFLDVIKQDYVRTARAKGLPESKVIGKHALRNALIPFITLMGTLLPSLLGGSVIVEQIFSIPGMGMLSFEAVLGRDHNLIMGLSAITAMLTLVSLLISDLLYSLADPRITLK